MLTWAPMGRRAAPAPCPACDTTLSDPQAAGDPPACPACGQPLVCVWVAGFWRRLLAAVADLGVLLLAAAPLNWALLAVVADRPMPEFRLGLAPLLQLLTLDPGDIFSPIAPFFAMTALYLVLFWGLSGNTPGQRLLRMRVIDHEGKPIGPLTALVRLVGLAAGLIAGALGPLWIAFDAERRGFHDHVSRTYVVRMS